MAGVPAGGSDPVLRLLLSTWRRLPRPVRVVAIRLGTPRYTVGSLVLLRRDGQFLLVLQRHTGRWALPGGLLKRGEPAPEAARRELAEELTVDLAAVRLPGGPDGPVPLTPVGVLVDAGPRRVDVLFAVDVDDAMPAPRPEHVEVLACGWFSPDALPPVSAITRQVLDRYADLGELPVAR